MSNNPYEILGVEPTATTEEIKAAYKRAAQKHHPDRENGDGDMFVEVKLAYEVLSDSARRKQYDDTGVYNRHQEADKTRQILVNLFLVVMGEGSDVKHENILDRMRVVAREKIAEINKADKRLLAEGDRLDDVMSRISNPNGENILEGVIKNKLDTINNAIDGNEVERNSVLAVLEMIDDYEYRPDTVEQITYADLSKYGSSGAAGASGIDWGSTA